MIAIRSLLSPAAQLPGALSGRLLTIARLVEKKGYKYAIGAVAQLMEQGYDLEYRIVGSADCEEFLRECTRERGVEMYVKFLGHVYDEELNREYRRLSCLCYRVSLLLTVIRYYTSAFERGDGNSNCLYLNDDLRDSRGDH